METSSTMGGYLPWIMMHNCEYFDDLSNLPQSYYLILFTGFSAYPKCSKCEVEMDIPLFYFPTDCKHLNYEWGEGGFGFVSVCPECKEPKLSYTSI